MSDSLARKIATLQNAESQKQIKKQEIQDQDRAKLLLVKNEHEQALQIIAENLTILSRLMPGLLKVQWSRRWKSMYGGSGPVLTYYSTGHDHRLQLIYNLEVDIAPELKGFIPSSYQISPGAKVEVIGMARATAIGPGRSTTTVWGMTAPLGELVLDPLIELRDADCARARLYESQIEALEKVKELLDEDKLAQVVFDLIPTYLR